MEEPQENQQPSSSNEEQPPKASSKLETFFNFCGHNVCIAWEIKSTLGISAIIWEAGKVLCRYLENEQIDFSGKKVIELGAGTGLVGILAILLGGDVTLTDQPFVLNQLEYNVATNITRDMMPRAKVSALMWGKDHEQFPTDYDYILGSDIIFSASEFPFMIETLLHLSNQNTIIYFCSKMRVEMGAVDFYEKVLPEYFDSEIVHSVPKYKINLYKITKKYPA